MKIFYNTTQILDVQVDDESYRYRTIMGEHTLNLKFALPEYVDIPVGAYCYFQEQRYTLETVANIKKIHTRNYEYDLILESEQYNLSKFIIRNTVPGDNRLKFSYTARPKEFMQLLVDNMNARIGAGENLMDIFAPGTNASLSDDYGWSINAGPTSFGNYHGRQCMRATGINGGVYSLAPVFRAGIEVTASIDIFAEAPNRILMGSGQVSGTMFETEINEEMVGRWIRLSITGTPPATGAFGIFAKNKTGYVCFANFKVEAGSVMTENWTVGDVIVDAPERVVSFNHNTCAEALQMIAETFETEWEVKNRTIYLRKVEYNKDNPLPLSYGRGNGFLPGIGRSEYSDAKPVQRLFVQGGDRNIDASKYRRNDATGQIGSRELLMPGNTTIRFDGVHFEDEDGFNASASNVREYITDESGASVVRIENNDKRGLIEGSLDCTSIYPMREGTVAEVIEVDAGKNFYDFTDNDPDIPDYTEYLIAGETMTVIFQEGMLAGKEFEVKYRHRTSIAPARFEIVPQAIDGVDMPGGAFVPQAGQKYGIFHVMLPDSYIADAERRMLKQAVSYLYENEMPRFTFTGTLDSIWASSDWVNIGGRIVLGGYIRFSDNQFLPDGMDIRITAIKDYVNKPHKPEIELSNNSQSGSWLHNLQRRVESDEVLTDTKDREVVQFAKRRFRDVEETMEMLRGAMLDFSDPANPITLQTMQAVVGDKMLQYDFSGAKEAFSFDPTTKTFSAPAGTITHKTLGVNRISSQAPSSYPYYWSMPTFASAVLDNPDQAYYLYAVVPNTTGGGIGAFQLSTEGRAFEQDENFNLLVGILNSEFDNSRSFAPLYGLTEILPGRILVDLLIAASGNSYINLALGTLLFANQGYTQGMDFGVTSKDQLTVKGTINALSAVLGGFKIDNDKFQSLATDADGTPNIELNGKTGAAKVTGSLQSNDGGNRILIDAGERSIKLIRADGTKSGEWSFNGTYGQGITISSERGTAILNETFLDFGPSRMDIGAVYKKYGLDLRRGFSVDASVEGVLNIKMQNLPTSAQGRDVGDVWVDNNGFLKVVK